MNAVETQLDIMTAVESREMFFRELYERTFYPVAAFVSKNGGSFEQAKDIFHEALIIFYETKLRDLKSISSPEAYVLGIAKHLWIKQAKVIHKTVDIEGAEIPADSNGPQVNEEKLLSWIEKTSKKCLDILQSFYFEKKNVRQVATAFGYSSEHSATVQKYKCLEKLRDEVKQKSLTHEDFIE